MSITIGELREKLNDVAKEYIGKRIKDDIDIHDELEEKIESLNINLEYYLSYVTIITDVNLRIFELKFKTKTVDVEGDLLFKSRIIEDLEFVIHDHISYIPNVENMIIEEMLYVKKKLDRKKYINYELADLKEKKKEIVKLEKFIKELKEDYKKDYGEEI